MLAKTLLALTIVVASLIIPTLAAATPAPAPAGTQQGIIMRDGGPCDPIRHMGC